MFVNRIEATTFGSAGPNVGKITATATGGGTPVVATIVAGAGETHLGFYAFPSTQTAYLTNWWGDVGTPTTDHMIFQLRFNSDADSGEEAPFRQIQSRGGYESVQNKGFFHEFKPYLKLPGPGIIKCQGTQATDSNVTASAGFGLILSTN